MKRILLSLIVCLAASTSLLFAGADKSSVGQKMPNFRLNDIQGRADLASGKAVIVEFWQTTCDACGQSIPRLKQLNAKYKGKGLDLVTITNENGSVVRNFLKSNAIDYNVARDGGTLFKRFGIRTIPHAVLVNKTGEIVWEGHPMALRDAEIEQVLK